jgi:hypothetical protein
MKFLLAICAFKDIDNPGQICYFQLCECLHIVRLWKSGLHSGS